MANKKVIGGVAAAIIVAVFAVEGGYVNNPKDPGGATNHGITEQVARQHDYKGDMRDLTREVAESIYYADYIEKQLIGFREGDRTNDGDSMTLRSISAKLSNKDIKALASYIQGLH